MPGSIPGLGNKIPPASGQLNPHARTLEASALEPGSQDWGSHHQEKPAPHN